MERIRVLSKESNKWDVSIGSEVLALHERLGLKNSDSDKIINEAVSILSACGNPVNESNFETGLVIGYVQSGKTLSFTTVTALASQNGFNCIIVLAGTTTKLVEQTSKRLERDLAVHNKSDVSWKQYINPSNTKEIRNEILCDLNDTLFGDKPVLLITVMKNITHLSNLVGLLGHEKIKSQNLKCLIIDDEADQASLNTLANKEGDEVSAIYRSIRNLRGQISNHTYLQYTATPQAPLFVSILDILSPNFVKILEPGPKYTGGKIFFKNDDTKDRVVRTIPYSEIYSEKNDFRVAPETLVEAMKFYYLTVAIGILRNEHPKTHNRTMMVHPSHLTKVHRVYGGFVENIKNRFIEDLRCQDIDTRDLINDFKKLYQEISLTEYDLPSFDGIEALLSRVIENTPVIVINSNSNGNIDWNKNYSMILVGGQVLDRGFTVEGLNVTYMPRSLGVGNSDTIQQRCRFFGYKRDYIDLCRVYIPRESKLAYKDYVLHEEDMRDQLKTFSQTEYSLNEFKRAFILSPSLNLTRKNVISSDITRFGLKGWKNVDFKDSRVGLNSDLIHSFLTDLHFNPSAFSGSNEMQKHQECYLSNETLIELLISLSYEDPTNSILVNHIISLLNLLGSEGISEVFLLKMSSGKIREREARNNRMNLFQGANKNTNYYGDRNAKDSNRVTVQFHHVKNKSSNEVYWLPAFHIPDLISLDIITFNES